jgi:hypothetical protein
MERTASKHFYWTGGAGIRPEDYKQLFSRSIRDPAKCSVDWEGMQLASLAAKGEAMLAARYLLSQAMTKPGFLGPEHHCPHTVGDDSHEAYLLECLPSCQPITFDRRGDSTPSAPDSQCHPHGIKLLPVLLRTQLVTYRKAAQQLYLDQFKDSSPDLTSVLRLVYKVISMHSLHVFCVLVFECVHVCILCV